MLLPTLPLGCDGILHPGIMNVFGGEELRPIEILVGVAQRELDGEELVDEKFENIEDRFVDP